MKRKHIYSMIHRGATLMFFQFLIFCFPYHLFAQSDIPIGSWQTHFSYQQAKLVKLAGNKVYCAAQNGLFYVDQSDNFLNLLSKLDGLSDVAIVAMDYQTESDLLMLAYKSSLIDVISDGRIGTFTLLKDSETAEQINDVFLLHNKAYVATSQGVRVLEISEDVEINIVESYTRLSNIGEPLEIYDVTIYKDSIYLATDEGVIANSLSINTNRQDFSSWYRYSLQDGLPDTPIRLIEQHKESVYAAVDGEGLYFLQNGKWGLNRQQLNVRFSSLQAKNQNLVAVATNQVYVFTDHRATFNTAQPTDAVMDTEGRLWIADEKEGLIRIDSNGEKESIFPNGPLSDKIYSIHYAGEKIFSLLDSTAAGFSTFQSGQWSNYDPATIAESLNLPSLASLIDVDYLPVPAEQAFYFASTGNGLLRWDGNGSFALISSQMDGNTLSNDIISSVEMEDNNLWITNYDGMPSLHRYDYEDRDWTSFTPGGLESRFPVEMVLAGNDMPWLLSSQQGAEARSGRNIIAYDTQENASLQIRAVINTADLPGDILTDMVKDQDGQIWVTGNEGVSYFPAPQSIFSSPSAIKPVFENQFLLFGDYVTSIAIDGGNRKWIGTRDGAWLFSETAEELTDHFTSANSPLPSNHILDITIDQHSGEVFFLTDKGMVSYRGTATQGVDSQQSVKIFPNPIPAGFEGQVGIEGLVTNANVKITTISGTLVRELRAEGGTAVWDVKDYHGSRVGTGVYLVFSAKEDGSQTFIAKVAVIN